MKGLALETIIAMIIALVGMIIFLSLTGYFKTASNWFFCNVYIKIQSFFSQKISIPQVCKQNVKEEVRIVEVKEGNKREFSRILLSYIIACFKEAEVKGLYKDHACYELHLKTKVEDVDEKYLTEVLKEEDGCKSIENSDYGCGEKNQILWNVENGVINTQSIILIRYVGKEDAVEVIG